MKLPLKSLLLGNAFKKLPNNLKTAKELPYLLLKLAVQFYLGGLLIL